MIRKLSSGFPKRHSSQGLKPEFRDAQPSKKSEVHLPSQLAKKSLFQGESSKLPVPTTRPTRNRSVERDVVSRPGSPVRKQKRRSRSYEGRSAFTTPSSSGMYRTPDGSAYHSSRRNLSSVVWSAMKTVPKDTRPLTEKNFQSQALTWVQKYIEKNHVSANYLPLTLTKPITLKTFIEVMNFMLRKLFPAVKLNQSNFVEEIPILMKKLMYPGTVSRSCLISANTPHSWPYVLGMMEYLVTILDCDTGLKFEEDDSDPIMDNEVATALHNDVKEAYTQYQCHGIEDIPLSPEFLEVVSKKFTDLCAEVKRMRKEIEVMEIQLNDPAVMAKMEREKALIKQLTDATTEAKSLREQCFALQNERNSREKRLAELEVHKAQIGMKLLEMKEQVATARKMVECQSLSVAERDELLAEITKRRDICSNHEIQKEDLQNSLYKETLELSRLRRNINKAVRKYNTNLLIHSDELPVKDLEINIDNVREEDLLQYVATVGKRLEECRSDLRKKLVEQEAIISEANAESQRLDEELARVSSQLAKAEQSHKLLRTAQKEKEEETLLRERRLEKRISELAREKEEAALKEAEREAEKKELARHIKEMEDDIQFIRTHGKAFLERRKETYRKLVLRREQKEDEMLAGVAETLEKYREAKRKEKQAKSSV